MTNVFYDKLELMPNHWNIYFFLNHKYISTKTYTFIVPLKKTRAAVIMKKNKKKKVIRARSYFTGMIVPIGDIIIIIIVRRRIR